MRIAFVWDWNIEPTQAITWKDGLAAAIRILSTKHELKAYTMGDSDYTFPHEYFPIHVKKNQDTLVADVKEFNPDVILCWGDTTRPGAKPLSELGKPMALCFAGGDCFNGSYPYFSHFFVESSVYKSRYEAAGASVSIAFGTNTELFQPLPSQQKIFDVFFPATFALWKRHNLLAEATRDYKTCVCGYMYFTHERDCWGVCEAAGNLVLPHLPPNALQRMYAASKTCVLPSMNTGGSQRSVLEAMAMNIPVIVCQDSDKTSEYVREAGEGAIVAPEADAIKQAIEEWKNKTVNTRDYILSKWSEQHYATNLENGLLNICHNPNPGKAA